MRNTKTNTNSKKKQSIGAGILFVLFTMVAIFASASMVHAADNVPLVGIDLLNQDPLPAKAGDIVVLRFRVENLGGVSADDVIVKFKPEYPFTLIKGNSSYSLSLEANSEGYNSAIISFTVQVAKDIQRASYPITLEYGRGNNLVTSSYVVETQNKEYAQIIFVNKAEISPGKETDLNFTINNVGSAPLQNMVFSWNEPTGALLPVYSDNTRYIKYLDAGQSETVSYKVIADTNANQGLYKLELNLKYESIGNSTSTALTTSAGVFIGGQTDFDVAFSESTAGQTSLSVANTGNNPAYSVSVKIPQQENYRVLGSTSAIIGNLDKGDYTLVSFQISSMSAQNFTAPVSTGGARQTQTPPQNQENTTRQFNRTGSGNPNTLLVTIQYTDTTGSRIEVNKTVPIQFKTSTSTTTTGTGTPYGRPTTTKKFIGGTLFWIIIVVIAGVGGYFFSKKKNKDVKKVGK